MTAPPPPPAQPDWPTGDATGGRERWWTGGRILLAVVIVLVLMGLAAAGGFVAGVAVTEAGNLGFGGDLLGEDEDGVPGLVPLDAGAEAGAVLRLGRSVTAAVADRPVEHPLVIEADGTVAIEVIDASFDTVLLVVDDAGALVASDDDGGQGTNSAIEVDLAAGTYAVRVQSWSGSGSGDYTLEAR